MLSKRSIRAEFAKQIIFASLALIALFSFILYSYIQNYIYDELREELLKEAESIALSNTKYKIGTRIRAYSMGSFKSGDTLIEVVALNDTNPSITYKDIDSKNHNYFQIIYPYNLHNNAYIVITKEISTIKKLLQDILRSIMIINFAGFIIIQIYAFGLSNILTKPISTLSKKLSKINETRFEKINTDRIPDEFEPLGTSLNSLFERLEKYLSYQKELFIGIAHELKTPLAVMKLKNEVALIKDRDTEKYKETIKLNIETIDRLNKMITQILDIGRQEGAQFEPLKEIDIVDFLDKKIHDYRLLAKSENKKLTYNLNPLELRVMIQPTLFNHIIQNFIQNAIKFTPENKEIRVLSWFKDNEFKIMVLDEGKGLDGDINIYAPFKKSGEESGAGLGLFIAKSAADSMGLQIALQNREDGIRGAVATIVAKLSRKSQKEPYQIKRIRTEALEEPTLQS